MPDTGFLILDARDDGYSMPEVRGQMIEDGIPTHNLGIQKTDKMLLACPVRQAQGWL